jgi:hypothetical protein
LSRGFRFLPTPQEAVTYYPPRLIDRKPLHAVVRPVLHHADVYVCAPGDLARDFCPLPRTGERFFFTPSASRKERAAEARAGSWRAQSTADIKGRGDGKVGELKKLRYKKRRVYGLARGRVLLLLFGSGGRRRRRRREPIHLVQDVRVS